MIAEISRIETLAALGNWRIRFTVLLAHFMTSRFKGNKFALILRLAEPIIWVWGMVLLRNLFRNMQPNFGTSLFLFYASGMFPYFLFMRIARRTIGIPTNPSRRPLPITVMDLILANTAVEVLVWSTMCIVLFYAMWIYGIDQARPESIADCAMALSFLIVIGLGVGLVNSAIGRFFPFWITIFKFGSRALLMGSGALAVVDRLPLELRNIVVWNPLAHGVEWFRLGIYGNYPTVSLDRSYLAFSAIAILFVGMIAHSATVRSSRR